LGRVIAPAALARWLTVTFLPDACARDLTSPHRCFTRSARPIRPRPIGWVARGAVQPPSAGRHTTAVSGTWRHGTRSVDLALRASQPERGNAPARLVGWASVLDRAPVWVDLGPWQRLQDRRAGPARFAGRRPTRSTQWHVTRCQVRTRGVGQKRLAGLTQRTRGRSFVGFAAGACSSRARGWLTVPGRDAPTRASGTYSRLLWRIGMYAP
jgi:hypothetical protein